jgi:hypothetical protein
MLLGHWEAHPPGSNNRPRLPSYRARQAVLSIPGDERPILGFFLYAAGCKMQICPATQGDLDMAALQGMLEARVDERYEDWIANGAFLSEVIMELVRTTIRISPLLTSPVISTSASELTSARAMQNAHFGVDIRRLGLKQALKERLAHCQLAAMEA